MADWKCETGACLMIPSGPCDHLFTVALGPAKLNGYGPQPQAVIVNFSTIPLDSPYDNSCHVAAGSHPFITHDSYVYYRGALIHPASFLEKQVADGVWKEHQAYCSTALISDIVGGFGRSKRLPRYYKDILAELGVT